MPTSIQEKSYFCNPFPKDTTEGSVAISFVVGLILTTLGAIILFHPHLLTKHIFHLPTQTFLQKPLEWAILGSGIGITLLATCLYIYVKKQNNKKILLKKELATIDTQFLFLKENENIFDKKTNPSATLLTNEEFEKITEFKRFVEEDEFASYQSNVKIDKSSLLINSFNTARPFSQVQEHLDSITLVMPDAKSAQVTLLITNNKLAIHASNSSQNSFYLGDLKAPFEKVMDIRVVQSNSSITVI